MANTRHFPATPAARLLWLHGAFAADVTERDDLEIDAGNARYRFGPASRDGIGKYFTWREISHVMGIGEQIRRMHKMTVTQANRQMPSFGLQFARNEEFLPKQILWCSRTREAIRGSCAAYRDASRPEVAKVSCTVLHIPDVQSVTQEQTRRP